MYDSDLKLNDIVSDHQLKQKYWSQLHRLNNSLKRNVATQNQYSVKHPQYYECLLPEVGFGRRDLSIILRYLIQKRQMSVADRNLFRRILISNFEEDIVTTGSRQIIEFLKLQQGTGEKQIRDRDSLFFLLKGSALVKSQNCEYCVSKGSIFGQIQLICDTKIDSIQFEGNYLMLVLEKKEFQNILKNYYIKKYSQKQKEVESLQEMYLSKIPKIAQYLLLKNIQYKVFTTGESIVSHKQLVENIYFLISNDKSLVKSSSKGYLGCLGLFQTINNAPRYAESIYCDKKRVRIPYIKASIFKQYVLDVISPENMIRNELDKSMINLNKSYLSISGFQVQEEKPKLIDFMRKKKIKITMKGRRIKTQTASYCETDFKFLKAEPRSSTHRYGKSSMRKFASSLTRGVQSSLSNKKFC